MHTFWCNDVRLSVIKCKEFLKFLIVAAWGLFPITHDTWWQCCCYITQLHHTISFNPNWKPVANCCGELTRRARRWAEPFISHLVQAWLSNSVVPGVMLSQWWAEEQPHLCTEMLRPHSLLSIPNWTLTWVSFHFVIKLFSMSICLTWSSFICINK